MKTLNRAALFTVLAALALAAAGQHANNERGFVADKVYNFSGLDAVNVFNGNLTLTLPLGGSYPVSSTLSYGLTLYYNSKVWDYHRIDYAQYRCGAWQDPGMVAYPVGFPTDVSNAGFGWRLSFGRLITPAMNFSQDRGIYISPDGASHEFYEKTRENDTLTDWSNAETGLVAIAYPGKESNTDLRIKKYNNSGTYYVLEFPDGTTHRFGSDGQVSQINDKFGNYVWLTRGTNAAGERLLNISDPQNKRSHDIIFKQWTGSDVGYFNGDIVDRVELAAFTTNDSDSAALPRAVYKFVYHSETETQDANVPVERGCRADQVGEYCSNFLKLPLLRQLVLPDGSKYKFDYLTSNSDQSCGQGSLREVVLPTGGKIEWTYGDYWLPSDPCGMNWRDYSVGVRQKTVHDGGAPKVWKYSAAHSEIRIDRSICEERYLPGGTPYIPQRRDVEYVIKSLTDPIGRTTLHYFSTWQDIQGSPNIDFDYGSPFTRTHPATSINPERFLSRKTCKTGTGLNADGTPNENACVQLQTSYVSYHYPNNMPPSFAASELTVFDDGNWVDKDQSSPDGFGHFRIIKNSSNFPALRSITTETNYNEGSVSRKRPDGKLFFKAGDPWLLNRFTTEKVSQSGTGSSTKGETHACFDAVTGVLKGKRVLKSPPATSAQDVVVRYTYHGIYDVDGKRGTVDREDWYGGDTNTIDHFDLCANAPATGSAFQLDHDTHRGALKTSRYRGANFLSIDHDIDRGMGLVRKSRDSAGVPTSFEYDTSGRLTLVAPFNRASTVYRYNNVTATEPAHVLVERGASGPAGTRAKFEYDPLGRMFRESQLMPDGTTWSSRETIFDEVGRRWKVTELGSSAYTEFQYDDLDRVKKIVAPDASVTEFFYGTTGTTAGDTSSPRYKVRKSKIATPGGTGDLIASETYDGLGRLLTVTEKSGPTTATSYTGTNVSTYYAYDHANRLTNVTGNGNGTTKQFRTFTYDGRGFLSQESHPENGTASYEYDSRGHVLSKDTTGTDFDLSFEYDVAERLTRVWEGTRLARRRPIKQFEFGSTGATLGKLWKAIRFNYPEAGFADQKTIRVTEEHGYDTAGRKATRNTDLEIETTPGVYAKYVNTIGQSTKWNALDLAEEIVYPTCDGCGEPQSGTRIVKPAYQYGRLNAIPGFIVSTAYNDAGIWRERVHSNGVRDVQEFDPSGMPRPLQFLAYGVVDCAIITQHPADVPISSGGSASFGVAVSDTNATYQWYRGVRGDRSNPLTGQTTNTLTVTNVTDTTSYWVEVKSGAGCVQESNTAQAIVCEPTALVSVAAEPPLNDTGTIITAETNRDVSIVVIATGTNTAYSWNVSGPNATTITGVGPIVAFKPATTGNWMVSMTITGSCGQAPIQLSWTVVVTEPAIGCTKPVPKSTFPEIIRLPASRPTVTVDIELEGSLSNYKIQWAVDGKTVKNATNTWFTVPVANALEITVTVSRVCGTVQSEAFTKSVFVFKPELCSVPNVTIDQLAITDSSPNKLFTATTAWPGATFQWFEGDSGNTRQAVVVSRVTELALNYGSGSQFTPVTDRSGTYWVRTFSACGLYTDSPTLTVTVNNCLPVRILRQPLSVESAAGQQQTLSFEPAATPDVEKVDWYHQHNNMRQTPDGSTSRFITVSPRKTTGYYAKATSREGCNSGYTGIGWVRVTSCNEINVSYVTPSQTIVKGNGIELKATVTSGLPLTYHWFEGEIGQGTYIGAGAILTRTPAVTTKYYVRITAGNPDDPTQAGCAIDRAVTITVCEMPVVTFEPIGAVSPAGFRRWLGIEASGTNLTYQWYEGAKGDTTKPISGGVYAQVQVAPPQTTDYWVQVSNVCGSDQSDAAKVSVPPVITSSLTGGLVTKGTTRTLSVTATGTQLRYQWYRGTDDTQPVSGATLPTFTTPPFTADVTYWARVWSGDAWVNTPDSAVFTVCQPRTLTISPNGTVSGTKVTLGVDYNDPNEIYEYYEGASGVTTKLLGTTAAGTSPYIYVEPAVTTSYWVRTKKGTECHADSAAGVVAVCFPKITTQPQSTMVNPNTTATLSVVAAGDPARTYQWYKGASGDTTQPIAGATGASYTTPALTAQTSYWVAVSHPATASCSSTATKSATATITICSVPSVTTQPISQTKPLGGSTTLSLAASGTDLTYQWYQGAVGTTTSPVANGTGTSVTVAPSATTTYWARVTGRCGTANTDAAKVYVHPTITTHPAGGPITKGTTRTLSVVATGNELTYQWYSGASTKVTGANSSSYTTPPINADASYWVAVYSGGIEPTGVSSNTATLTVCQPRNATFAQTSTVTGSTVTLQVDAYAAGESFEWYRGASGVTTAPAGTGINVNVYPTDTTDYWVRTKRSGCDADSASIRVPVCRPRITTEPANASITRNQTTTLSVVATGPGTLTYQWYAGDAGVTSNPVSGCTGASCAVTPLTTTKYWVRVTSPVTSSCPSNTSSNSIAATVTVCQPPAISTQPMSVVKPDTGAASLSVTATGTSLTYQWYQGAAGTTTSPVSGATGASVNVSPSATTTYWVRVSGSCGSVDSSVAKVYVKPVITTHPAGGPITKGTSRTLSVVATGNELTYAWFQGVDTGIPGANSSSYTTPAINADTTYWVAVFSGGVVHTASNSATLTVCQPRAVTFTQSSSVAESPVTFRADVYDPSETYLWYRGASGDTSNPIGTGWEVTIYPTQTATYWLRTRRAGCDADSAAVTVAVCYPKITTQPANAGIIAGQSTTLSVAATGPTPMTYQWYIGSAGVTTNPISTCTSASCAVSPASTTSYWVRVSGPTGLCSQTSVNSTAATVTVCQPVSITAHPQNVIAGSNGYATLSISTSGTVSSYQWYEGASGVTTKPVGTNSSSLTIQPLTTKYYWVRVTSACGATVNSNAALVSVRPQFTTQPVDTNGCQGKPVTFTVATTGDPATLTYQWQRQLLSNYSVANIGTNSPTLTITATEGMYIWCTVTSGQASQNSTQATLSVATGPYAWLSEGTIYASGYRNIFANVIAEEAEFMTYSWYQGRIGDTSIPLGSSYYIYVNPSPRPKYYWVKITDSRTGCPTELEAAYP